MHKKIHLTLIICIFVLISAGCHQSTRSTSIQWGIFLTSKSESNEFRWRMDILSAIVIGTD